MTSLRHVFEFLAFRIIVCSIDCLSPRMAATCATNLAWLVHYGLPRKVTRYAVASENLKLAFGDSITENEIDRTIYRMWIHLFRTLVEIVQSPRKLHLHSYRDAIEFADFTRTNQAVCSGRRVLLLGGHFGSWEIGPTLFGLWGFPMGIVAREMDNPYLHE
ncbi:MAG: lipid A biosynthesis acyltransferase, partial [Planctomycetes bacterium]|nr:lipid A biosynthesis acyltransferase [Planctomycetota bacterium]